MKLLRKKWYLIGILLMIVWSLMYLYSWVEENKPNQNELCKQGVLLYKNYNLQGVVLNKFINKENHNDKTVIVKEKYGLENILILDADIGGVFNYIEVGDSLVKKDGDLFLLINRNGRDTIIDFKFRCY